jgi:hypothetical protein
VSKGGATDVSEYATPATERIMQKCPPAAGSCVRAAAMRSAPAFRMAVDGGARFTGCTGMRIAVAVLAIMLLTPSGSVHAASGGTLSACLARKLHAAGTACRLAIGVASEERIAGGLARAWAKAESRAASAGVDCRTGTSTADEVTTELTAGTPGARSQWCRS